MRLKTPLPQLIIKINLQQPFINHQLTPTIGRFINLSIEARFKTPLHHQNQSTTTMQQQPTYTNNKEIHQSVNRCAFQVTFATVDHQNQPTTTIQQQSTYTNNKIHQSVNRGAFSVTFATVGQQNQPTTTIQQQSTYTNNKKIHQSVYRGAFEDAFATVHHQFGIFAGEDDHSKSPFRVAQNATTQ